MAGPAQGDVQRVAGAGRGHVFATNESGKTYVFKANPDSFELVAENQLGTDVFATPVICGNAIYIRAAVKTQGRREEWLYCIGASE